MKDLKIVLFEECTRYYRIFMSNTREGFVNEFMALHGVIKDAGLEQDFRNWCKENCPEILRDI